MIFALITTLARLLATNRQTQQALRWWYQRQSSQLHESAERIRNGVLQESLAMRRFLELALRENTSISEQLGNTCLRQLEAFYQTLEQLSNDLSPPYFEESLPLAIQYMLHQWQTSYPQTKLLINLPLEWRPEPSDRSRVILMALDELLKIVVPKLGLEESILIRLISSENSATMLVQITNLDVHWLAPQLNTKELAYIQNGFEFYTLGRYRYRVDNSAITWQFIWQLQEIVEGVGDDRSKTKAD